MIFGRPRHHLKAVRGMSGTGRAALALLVGAAGLAACSHAAPSASVPDNGCAPAVNERIDPRSSIHLFPSAPEPHYVTDPPTSGPHRLGPPYQGVVDSPIPRPSQVAMLESGYVIVQSQGLAPEQLTALDDLVGHLVTVAPPTGPLPSPVVATAWTWKLECGSATPPALAAIRAFIAAHRGVGFAGNIPTTVAPTATS